MCGTWYHHARPPTDQGEGNHGSERWSLAVAPRGGARASCGRAAGGLRSGARISQAKLIPPRHAGRPPARGCAVLGRAAVSSPLRPLRHGVPCGAGSPASSTPLTGQLSSSARAEGSGAGPRTLATSLLRPARAARCTARVPPPGDPARSLTRDRDARSRAAGEPPTVLPFWSSARPIRAAAVASSGHPGSSRVAATKWPRVVHPVWARAIRHLGALRTCRLGAGVLRYDPVVTAPCAPPSLGSRSCGSGGRASTHPTASARRFELSHHSCS